LARKSNKDIWLNAITRDICSEKEKNMNVKDLQEGKVLIVKPLENRIEASNSTAFKGFIVDKINDGARQMILDLSAVEFVDSSGLGAIVSCLKTIGDEGNLVMCGVSKTVMNLFKLTRMTRIFQFFKTPADAVEALTE
jgi:anti-sigma B factor antagonist